MWRASVLSRRQDQTPMAKKTHRPSSGKLRTHSAQMGRSRMTVGESAASAQIGRKNAVR